MSRMYQHTNETGMKILKSYFQRNSVSKFQIDSYNYFIKKGIHEIFENEQDIEVCLSNTNKVTYYKLSFKDVYIDKPVYINKQQKETLMFPNEARMRNMTYESPILVTVEETINDKIRYHNRFHLTNIPVMVGSDLCNLKNCSQSTKVHKFKECPNDDGGYFIVKGTERVIVSQITNTYNRIHVSKKKAYMFVKLEACLIPRNTKFEFKYSMIRQLTRRLYSFLT